VERLHPWLALAIPQEQNCYLSRRKQVTLIKTTFLTILIIIAFFSYQFIVTDVAVAGGPGSATATFLKLIPDARAAAMGGAAVAGAGAGAESLYWNPAANAKLRGVELETSYVKWWDEVNYGYLGCAFGPVGLSVTFLQMTDFTVTDAEGNETDVVFTPQDIAVGLSYARTVGESLAVSAGGKFIRSDFVKSSDYTSGEDISTSVNGFAADVSALYETVLPGLKLGFAVQNIGQLKYSEKNDNLPWTMRFGAAYTPSILGDDVLAALDLSRSIDGSLQTNWGIEVFPFGLLESFSSQTTTDEVGFEVQAEKTPSDIDDLLALRIGHQGELTDVFGGLVAGFGIRYFNFQFDYAYSPFENLNSAHRFSFKLIF